MRLMPIISPRITTPKEQPLQEVPHAHKKKFPWTIFLLVILILFVAMAFGIFQKITWQHWVMFLIGTATVIYFKYVKKKKGMTLLDAARMAIIALSEREIFVSDSPDNFDGEEYPPKSENFLVYFKDVARSIEVDSSGVKGIHSCTLLQLKDLKLNDEMSSNILSDYVKEERQKQFLREQGVEIDG